MEYFIAYFSFNLLLFYMFVDRHGKFEKTVKEIAPPLLQDGFIMLKWFLVILWILLLPVITIYKWLQRLIHPKDR